MENNEHSIKLVVVDSLTSLLWTLKRPESNAYMMQVVNTLKSMSIDFSFAVLYTTATTPQRFQFSSPSIRSNVSLDIQTKMSTKPGSTNGVRLVTMRRSTRQQTGRSVEIAIEKNGVR